jgi:hypothetical protein
MSNDRALTPPDVVGVGEILAILQISHEAFRRHHRERPDFPPVTHLDCGRVYERRAITAYALQRATGKPYLRALELYRQAPDATAYQRCTTVVNQLASEDIRLTRPTVRAYLKKLGEIQS